MVCRISRPDLCICLGVPAFRRALAECLRSCHVRVFAALHALLAVQLHMHELELPCSERLPCLLLAHGAHVRRHCLRLRLWVCCVWQSKPAVSPQPLGAKLLTCDLVQANVAAQVQTVADTMFSQARAHDPDRRRQPRGPEIERGSEPGLMLGDVMRLRRELLDPAAAVAPPSVAREQSREPREPAPDVQQAPLRLR